MKTDIIDKPELRWIDVADPTEKELLEIAEEHGLHPVLVRDCLQPGHLPKYEELDGAQFILLRMRDPKAKRNAATVHDLTRKLALFISKNLFLTIHQASLTDLELPIDEWKASQKKISAFRLWTQIARFALNSFQPLLEDNERALEKTESNFNVVKPRSSALLELHQVRRQLFTIKRLLWHTLSVLQRLSTQKKEEQLRLAELKETAEGLAFFSDDLLDDATGFMNLHISIASQRTNEIMRVLTIFSAFFLPLTFIVGVYGMNFHHMPELNSIWGYPAVMIAMALVTLTIYLWFRHKRWLGRSR
jgi:magnesium transporter